MRELQKLCCKEKRRKVDSFSIKWLQEKRAEEERRGSLRANQYGPDVIYWPRCENSEPWQDIALGSKKGFWICRSLCRGLSELPGS